MTESLEIIQRIQVQPLWLSEDKGAPLDAILFGSSPVALGSVCVGEVWKKSVAMYVCVSETWKRAALVIFVSAASGKT